MKGKEFLSELFVVVFCPWTPCRGNQPLSTYQGLSTSWSAFKTFANSVLLKHPLWFTSASKNAPASTTSSSQELIIPQHPRTDHHLFHHHHQQQQNFLHTLSHDILHPGDCFSSCFQTSLRMKSSFSSWLMLSRGCLWAPFCCSRSSAK